MDEEEHLKKAITMMKETGYTNPENVSDEEALGRLISNYFDWDGIKIIKTLLYGLENSNYHAAKVLIRNVWNGWAKKEDPENPDLISTDI